MDLPTVQTNILLIQSKQPKLLAKELADRLGIVEPDEIAAGVTDKNGNGIVIKASARDWEFLRLVLYEQVDDEQVELTIKKLTYVIKQYDARWPWTSSNTCSYTKVWFVYISNEWKQISVIKFCFGHLIKNHGGNCQNFVLVLLELVERAFTFTPECTQSQDLPDASARAILMDWLLLTLCLMLPQRLYTWMPQWMK